jgi:CRP/FNR family transcriptional regulator
MLHTHDEIAAFAATSRESVTRTLSKFRHDKYIHVQGIWIKILEPEKLALLAV